jgi:2-dehydro-3-deoxygluconokinase
MKPSRLRFATIGECMVHYEGAGHIIQSFGGDTFNIAAYARRLGERSGDSVEYVSAIGGDPFSADMADFWARQGVCHRYVLRRPNKKPGLYFIKFDAQGKRSVPAVQIPTFSMSNAIATT